MCETNAEDPVCKSLFTLFNSLRDFKFIDPSKKNKLLDRNHISHTLTQCFQHMFGHFPLQVVYRQAWNSVTSVLETNKTSMELQIPAGENYLIEIKTLTEGGDGSSSGPIRIPKMSSKLPNAPQHVNDWSWNYAESEMDALELIPCVTDTVYQLFV